LGRITARQTDYEHLFPTREVPAVTDISREETELAGPGDGLSPVDGA